MLALLRLASASHRGGARQGVNSVSNLSVGCNFGSSRVLNSELRA